MNTLTRNYNYKRKCTQRHKGSLIHFLKCLKWIFQYKVNTTDFIDDEFVDWKEKINPFSAAILLHDEHTCIELINYYLNIRQSKEEAISLVRRGIFDNTVSELFAQNINLEKAINHKIHGNLKNKTWNDAVKPYVGYTPLHLAVHKDFSEVVDILLKEIDIDPNVKNNEGLTPLELAIKLDDVKMAKNF